MGVIELSVAIWLIPALASFIAYLAVKVSRNLGHAVSVLSALSSWILAIMLLFAGSTEAVIWIPIRFRVGEVAIDLSFGAWLDGFAVFMANVVTFVSLWIFVFSIGYMAEEKDIGRYWFLMNIFLSAMILLVLSISLLQMFIAWEVVGLCSWALISFWYKSTAPSPDPRFRTEGEYNAHCGLKALITTSLADILFIIGIIIIGISVLTTHGSLTFNMYALSKDAEWITYIGTIGIMPLFSALIISGPLGKSAQFPYHEWLPEAMAGPTTVSALIHAATMVKAGAYFVGRFFIIMTSLEHIGAVGVSYFFMFAAYIGSFTAFLAATQAIVAKELKKILAYSTISQLGYIFAAFGLAGLLMSEEAFFGGAFHIASHATFKALLFLCAGGILHTVHSKYVYDMGGLKKYMPLTYITMLIGALSLSSAPPFAGFFSKEIIIHEYMMEQQEFLVPYLLLLVTAIITVFYTFRMIGMVFHGEESDNVKKLASEGKIHEVPLVMEVPLVVLAGTSIVLGFLGGYIQEYLVGEAGITIFDSIVHALEYLVSETTLMALGIFLLGFIPAWLIYFKRVVSPEKIVDSNVVFRIIYKFLEKRWYINSVYYFIVAFMRDLASVLRSIQTGVSNANMGFMAVGILVALILLILL